MLIRDTPAPPRLKLRPGELVRVRSVEEILSTLDEDGTLDGLPFMPEMLAFAGRVLPVRRTAVKTCDGMGDVRTLPDAVFLEGAACDGSAHDGCQAACPLHWKEAWLERVPAGTPPAVGAGAGTPDPGVLDRLGPTSTPGPDGPRYRCQATAIVGATQPLSPWRPGQYVHDVRNWGWRKLLLNLALRVVNKYQRMSRRFLPRWALIAGGSELPTLQGRLDRTPRAELGLQPGDLVRIKSKAEIEATLDRRNRNRGLEFDREELRFCGMTTRVAQKVERLIDGPTGRMITLSSDCWILEGVACPADHHKLCARGIPSFWREVWLEKVSGDP